MRGVALLVLLSTLAGCHPSAPTPAPAASTTPSALEAAAIQAGIVADPASTDITGSYASETDRVCIVPTPTAYRIGVYVDYGDQHCTGTGTVSRAGEALHVELGGGGACTFDARFEGDRVAFPGRVPDGCERLCERRASLAALDVTRLSGSVSEASTLRDGKGRLLCGISDVP